MTNRLTMNTVCDMSAEINEPGGDLGGFQAAAEVLTRLAGRTYSRQTVQQLWERRHTNGFPEREEWTINGRLKVYLDMQEVADWYSFPEAAAVLTAVSGKLYNPADVYHLWQARDMIGFPDRKQGPERLYFDLDEVGEWFRSSRKR